MSKFVDSVGAAVAVLLVGCASAPEAPATADPEPAEREVAEAEVSPEELPPQLRPALRVDTVIIRPERIELTAGETFGLDQLQIEPRDEAGQRVEQVPMRPVLRSRIATLEADTLETGVVRQVIRAREPGEAELIIALPRPVPAADRDFEIEARLFRVPVVVNPGPVATIDLRVPRDTIYTGMVVPIEAEARTEAGDVREAVEVDWSASPSDVVRIDRSGVLRAVAPGRATVTAMADGVRETTTVEVVDNPVRSLEVTPTQTRVRTGDVVGLAITARGADGNVIEDVPVSYAVTNRPPDEETGAAVYRDGTFVAEAPGTYRVRAAVGSVAGESVITAEPRNVGRDLRPVGLGLVSHHPTSDLWVFEGNDGRDYAYTGTHTGGQKMYAWDVTDPSDPVITDSIVVDARVVNDVKVNEDASLAVITREGASDRRNGLVILDLSDPAHPTVLSEYTATLTGGVHNTYIVDDLVYAIHDGTLDVHIIDISDPRNPSEVGRWGIERPGKYLHDIWVEDGIAYVSYWDDGLYILDVGDGRWGGTPTDPAVVSSYEYRTRWGTEELGNTHVAFPYRNSDGHRYVFVGDEIFGCEACISRVSPDQEGPRGHVHVIDIDDLENPEEVAFYKVPEAGVHNLWAADDKLYAAYYQGGLRVVDISGELRGDLYEQEREMAWIPTGTEEGYVPNSPFAWGPQPYKGNIFVSDYNSGLWVIRLEEE